ncbi:DUF6600 domain-containing protein [Piscinibacter sp. XHJ-5]|uniref:DUF6600 domain-containing protein n=1 Tax=Piscinibacter sp. XHJ-5 TaxID=3037797 RepID=UPI002452905E|nr:DUF6600 domain-containing protein [Piscinibacter sp. XHJ-5]
MRRFLTFLAVLLCTAATTAWADPPGRVGRVGELTGQVWLYTPDAGEWVSAERNRPLTTGDRLSTDASAHADVHIGSTTIRLDSGTELEVLGIDDDTLSLQLHSGSVATRLRDAESAREFEMRTAEGRFVTHRPGRYRFDRNDQTSHVTVWSGEALYEGPGSALTVNAGQHAEFWMEGAAAQYSITEPARDSFAAWNNERDRRDERSASTRYVSPEMTGVEDLDRYGRWEQAPEYGTVWVPRNVPAGWAPYGAGHWVWISPWGWTWVDDMPWGFAPFHYGRWAYSNQRWCWVPGSYVRRPVYAPALVGWVGGPHLSVSVSIGNRGPGVGWFPLAPREVYVPYYRVSPRYVQQVNVTHVTQITNVTTIINNPQNAVRDIDYRNRRFPHAVTVVPQEVMVNRKPVAPAAAQWRTTAVQQLANQPARDVVVPAPTVASPVLPPAAAEARRVRRHDMDPGRPGFQAVAPSTVVVPPSPVRANLATPTDAPANVRRYGGDRARGRDGDDVRAAPSVQSPAAAPRAVIVPPQAAAVQTPPPAAAPKPPAAVPAPPSRVAPQPDVDRNDRADWRRRSQDVPGPPQASRQVEAPAPQAVAPRPQPQAVAPQQPHVAAPPHVQPAEPPRPAQVQQPPVQRRQDGNVNREARGQGQGREENQARGRGEGRERHAD